MTSQRKHIVVLTSGNSTISRCHTHTHLVKDAASQELQVNLMDDARTRRDNAEIVKGLRSPLEKTESLVVPLHLNVLVLFESAGAI